MIDYQLIENQPAQDLKEEILTCVHSQKVAYNKLIHKANFFQSL